jgi:hypothetical protein
MSAADVVNAIGRETRRTVRPPTLDDAAMYGPLGDFVRIVAPHTEGAPAALLASGLSALGALIGRGPVWHFGDTDHHARLFVLLVGPTGSGRKGTTISASARRILRALDTEFVAERVANGLSSAEGLIALVRDATPDRVHNGRQIPGDPGISDKRLLLIEEELGGPLEAMAREGNRLSAVLREAWDGRDLRSIVKLDPQRATAPHVCIISGITPSELSKSLRAVAVKNGLANRFLPVWASRAQLLPHDTRPDPAELQTATDALAHAVVSARRVQLMDWTPAARDLWAPMYADLAVTPHETETVRALLQRGAPYVRRLAMLYALLDGSSLVDVPHLTAARALWDYCAGTWRVVYAEGESRSPLGERLLAALLDAGAAGLSREELRIAAGSNDTPAERIAGELNTLATEGLAQRERVRTAGRPREVWRHARYVGAQCPPREEREEREESSDQPSPVRPFLPSLPSFPVGEYAPHGAPDAERAA